MASIDDFQLAGLAAGFTLGFGFLTTWEAIKQTKRNRNPLRSTYIYMLWGEIAANIAIGILGWLFLSGVIGPTLPVLLAILFFWVLEIQLLMQIIVNRVAIIAESQKTVRWIKWGTAGVITLINIAVFVIWVPSHLDPPAAQIFVDINNVWDKISKVLILIVDAWLNWYFLKTVKQRLLNQHGLIKYKPLVSFNANLMIVSIGMDAMLIGLMFLKNPVVYIQFHPVAYMVKLNIEMSMAALITRLAKDKDTSANFNSLSYSHGQNKGSQIAGNEATRGDGYAMKSFSRAKAAAVDEEDLEASPTGNRGIHRRFDVEIRSEPIKEDDRSDDTTSRNGYYKVEDETSLAHHPGHPK